MDLFVQQSDGKKVIDPDKQDILSSRLKLEMLHPLRVVIANRGPDAELLIANPVELCGKGRPRVFHDVTLALKLLGICIFSVSKMQLPLLHYLTCSKTSPNTIPCYAQAEIGRHTAFGRQWEVYRFLLDDSGELPPANSQARSQIVDRVRRTMMGW